MADGRKDYYEKRLPGDPEEDPDFYISTLAAPWGHLDLIQDWLKIHGSEPGKVTEKVLFPAAMYGQLEVLEVAIPYGEC